MKEHDLNAYVRGLQRQAQHGTRKRARKVASPDQIARLGIRTEGG